MIEKDATLIRQKAIQLFYEDLLGRKADEAGLNTYVDLECPLEFVYYILANCDEAREYDEKVREKKKRDRENPILPMTLATFMKNNEASIGLCIESMKSIVSEIVVLDTGSTDNSVKICEDLGAKVYRMGQVDFSKESGIGFGELRTLCAGLCREPYIFMLDSDEVILKEDLPKFKPILKRMEIEDIDIVGLPRKRWADLDMKKQEEPWAWPDMQYRLFKNKPEIRFEKRVHEKITGSDKRIEDEEFPCIQHFQNVFKVGEGLKRRNDLYKKLFDLDVLEGVEQTGKAVEDIDER